MQSLYLKPPRAHGIDTPHRKNTSDIFSVEITPPATVTVPFTQHIGAPALPVAEVGEQVFVGSLLAKAGGFVSADTHSPVSGRIKRILEVLFPDGSNRPAFYIENDGLSVTSPSVTPPTINNRDDLVAAIARSGLVGLGGAGFPTHVKLAPLQDKPPCDWLIINGAECEPYITSDYREIMENIESVVDGILTIKRLLSIEKVAVAIEDNKPRAIKLLREKFLGTGVYVLSLRSSYPQGAEKILIAKVTGHAVPAGGLPSDAGAVVLNVGTVSFISRYLKTGMPLVKKRITVDGGAIAEPKSLWVPIGTSIAHIVDFCGGYKSQPGRVLMGGPMMGTALWSDEFPLLKNNNAITVLSTSEVSPSSDMPCIHCGRCAYHCPMALSTAELAEAVEREDIERLQKLSISNCIECGSCTFGCPAGRPLTQTMRIGKGLLRRMTAKK